MVLHDNSLYMYMFILRVAICSVTETRDNCKLKIVGSTLQSKVYTYLFVSFIFHCSLSLHQICYNFVKCLKS